MLNNEWVIIAISKFKNMFPNKEITPEVMSEINMILLECMSKYKKESGAVTTYIYNCVYFYYCKKHRTNHTKKRSGTTVSVEEVIDENFTIEDTLGETYNFNERLELEDTTNTIVNLFPNKYRKRLNSLITSNRIYDMTTQDICDELGISTVYFYKIRNIARNKYKEMS